MHLPHPPINPIDELTPQANIYLTLEQASPDSESFRRYVSFRIHETGPYAGRQRLLHFKEVLEDLLKDRPLQGLENLATTHSLPNTLSTLLNQRPLTLPRERYYELPMLPHRLEKHLLRFPGVHYDLPTLLGQSPDLTRPSVALVLLRPRDHQTRLALVGGRAAALDALGRVPDHASNPLLWRPIFEDLAHQAPLLHVKDVPPGKSPAYAERLLIGQVRLKLPDPLLWPERAVTRVPHETTHIPYDRPGEALAAFQRHVGVILATTSLAGDKRYQPLLVATDDRWLYHEAARSRKAISWTAWRAMAGASDPRERQVFLAAPATPTASTDAVMAFRQALDQRLRAFWR